MTRIAELARHYWDAEESRDVDRILGCFTPDAEWSALGEHVRGREAIGVGYAESGRLFPGLSVTIGRILGDDDEAAVEWHARFTDPSGRVVEVAGVNIFRLEGELIASLTVYLDPTPLLDAVGSS